MDELVTGGEDQPLPEEGHRLRRHGQFRCRARPHRAGKSVRFEAVEDRPRRRRADRASRPARRASRRRRCTSIAISSPSPTAMRRRSWRSAPNDVFVGTPPLAFTFGLGGAGDLSAALRGGLGAAGGGHRRPLMVEIKTYKATISLRRAYRLPAHAGAEGRRPPISRRSGSPCRRARRCRPRLRCLDASDCKFRCSTASAEPRCCTSSSPTASAMPCRRPGGRSAATRRGSSATT